MLAPWLVRCTTSIFCANTAQMPITDRKRTTSRNFLRKPRRTHGREKKNDDGRDRGQSRILPRSPGENRPRRNHRDATTRGDGCRGADARAEQVRRGGNVRRREALRGTLSREG